jgi:hypothetical protein
MLILMTLQNKTETSLLFYFRKMGRQKMPCKVRPSWLVMVMRLEFPVVLSEARDVQNTIGINTKGNFNLRGAEGMLESSNLLSNLLPLV